MKVKIKKLSMNEASKMTSILNQYSCEALLKSSENFCVDGKSLLGAIAATYFEDAVLEISELDSSLYAELNGQLMPFYA